MKPLNTGKLLSREVPSVSLYVNRAAFLPEKRKSPGTFIENDFDDNKSWASASEHDYGLHT